MLQTCVLTTEQFFAHVLSRKPRTAAFDCDGTLWWNNSGTGFMRWEIAQGVLPKHAADELLRRYALYERGAVSEVAMCGEMVSCHAGLREADVIAAAERYAEEHIAPNVFPEMQELVRRLADDGCDLWAVSSTATWVVRAGLRRFDIPPGHVLGVDVAVKDGVLTDELIAVPTDECKAEALIRAGLAMPDAVFGNSRHDVAMLEIGRTAYAVNPFADLREIAEIRGWLVYQPGADKR